LLLVGLHIVEGL
jgi:hypothetical protein